LGMRHAVILGLLAGVLATMAVCPAESPTKPKKTNAGSAAKVRTTRGKNARGGSKRARGRKPPAPSYQLRPDPARYQQIQQALAERGYFKGPPDGNWNDDSVDALKRFQTDTKLEPDGKISAHTLTGLGLGPKHDGTSAGTVPLSATESTPANPPDVPPITEVPEGNDPQ
jgi:hypothetical protein